jgi:hypothetical protein
VHLANLVAADVLASRYEVVVEFLDEPDAGTDLVEDLTSAIDVGLGGHELAGVLSEMRVDLLVMPTQFVAELACKTLLILDGKRLRLWSLKGMREFLRNGFRDDRTWSAVTHRDLMRSPRDGLHLRLVELLANRAASSTGARHME